MKRSNFLKGLLGLPFAVKAITKEEGLPKDKDGFYLDKREFEKEVRTREMKKDFSRVTISMPLYDNYITASYLDLGSALSYTTGVVFKDINTIGYHNSKL